MDQSHSHYTEWRKPDTKSACCTHFCNKKTNSVVYGDRGKKSDDLFVDSGRMMGKSQERTIRGDGNVLHFDLYVGYMDIYIFQNSLN